MKRYGNLYHKIYAMDNLELAYHDARKGKTWQKQIQRVDAHKEENLERLQKNAHESCVPYRRIPDKGNL